MRLIKLILSVVIVIFAGIFLYENRILNPDKITLWLYPRYQLDLDFPVILALTLLLGALIGFFIAVFQILTYKRESILLKSKNKRLQVELDSLRNQAIDDELIISDTNDVIINNIEPIDD
tara:strand:+ start:36 stop:395 length:360 start_codon:yes stop_codon:yes gene_type:complete